MHAGHDANVAGRDIINNYLRDPSADEGALGEIDAGEGAELLARLAAVPDTLNRARKVLTTPSPDVAALPLKEFLKRYESLAIGLLAVTNEVKVASLVSALGSAGAVIEDLLTARNAITECESAEHKALGERVGWFTRTTSGRGTQGFRQRYANGAIHCSPGHGAHATTGEIAQCHSDAGGVEGPLGFPVAAELYGEHPRTGTKCSCQFFEGPADYGPEVRDFVEVRCGGTVASSEKHGTHATWGAIGELSELGWRDGERLGLPAGRLAAAGPSQRADGAGTSGWRQRFESGIVYYCEKAGAIRVPRRWADYLEGRGGVAGPTGFPVSPEMRAAPSPYGTTGSFQRFEGPWDYPDDIVGHWSAQERPGGATIYHSAWYGPHTVWRGTGVLYEPMNGTVSWLGFPTSDESPRPAAGDPERTIQSFEGGAIFYSQKYDSVAVKRGILDYLAKQPYCGERLGFPTGARVPLGSRDGDYAQFFEHGVVAVRDGQVQAWLDPSLLLRNSPEGFNLSSIIGSSNFGRD